MKSQTGPQKRQDLLQVSKHFPAGLSVPPHHILGRRHFLKFLEE